MNQPVLISSDLLAYHLLWHEALRVYVTDAILYTTRAKLPKGQQVDNRCPFEEAYTDLINNGPILSWLCEMTDMEPEWIRANTIRKIRQKSS